MKYSQREFEVCKLVSEGKNNNQIAQILNISTHTVKAHLNHIFQMNENIKNRTRLAYILGKENIC